MLFSRSFIPTLRQDPAEADAISHRLLVRGGFIRKVSAGIYEWLPLGFRVLKKVERIVREEMDAAGAQEVWLPIVQPKELWEASGRWVKYGKELLRFKDRKEAEFCLAATAEELMTELVGASIKSWRTLPIALYQFGTKFRDELRPRYGVLRCREFYMKDAYSFHADDEDAGRYYEIMRGAYSRIFDRLGLRYRIVEADTGPIGGSFSHEFMVLSDTGEDQIVYCTECSYAANLERADCGVSGEVDGNRDGGGSKDETVLPQEVPTPSLWSVEEVSKFLKIPQNRFIKTLFYLADGKQPIVCLLRGDHALNEAKLRRTLPCDDLRRMSEAEYVSFSGAPVGFAGPQGLQAKAKAYHAQSQIVADYAIRGVRDGVSGANRKDCHTIHLQFPRDFQVDCFADIRFAISGDTCPRCQKGKLAFQKGIEVGHIFKLGIKYSEAMRVTYLNAQGNAIAMVMGCYGIGVSRIVAAACEQNHDKDGILWPRAIAPYEVVIASIETDDPQVVKEAEHLYSSLKTLNVQVLMDDREESAGVKFKDADLLGIPLRVVVSRRGLALGKVELKLRNTKTSQQVALNDACKAICSQLDSYKF